MQFIYKNTKGIILIFVMILLQITSMIGLYALTLIKHNRQVSIRLGQSMVLRQQSIRLFEKIHQKLLNMSPGCLVPTHSVNQFSHEPLSWWKTFACNEYEYIGQAHYFYVIELLDKDPCVTLDSINRITVVYYRISILSQSDTVQGLHLLMQSVIAQKINDHLICQEPLRQVTLGRQMVRELTF